MFRFVSSSWRIIPTVIVTLAIALALPLSALANVSVTKISEDTYTNSTSQHKTQVESDTFSFGSTIVAVQQTGRFFDGGSSNIAWATSVNDGTTWVSGNLPGITKHDNLANPYDRVSDPAVAYDAQDGVWIVSTLAITEVGGGILGAAVLSSRSTDSTGTAWNNPVVVSAATGSSNLDKNWIACDNNPGSASYGNCYSQWDDNGQSNKLYMSTSTNGGLTWGAKKATKGNYHGLGGQPVVQTNGTVCVPYWTGGTQIGAFRSTNGGGSWSTAVLVANISSHTVAGGLRTSPLPSAEVDGAGKVYVVWQDSSFRSGGSSNDIVMSTSTNCTNWTAKVRIPIDTVTSGVDHFIPGIAVDRSTSGSTAHIGITYYYYPVANCTFATCALRVGYISSSDGGTNWSAPTEIAGPMTLSWLPNTSQGPMVGDYTSTSYSASGLAHGAFAIAFAPSSGGSNCATATPNCDQATYTTANGQAAPVVSIAETPVELNSINMNAAEHANDNAPFTSR